MFYRLPAGNRYYCSALLIFACIAISGAGSSPIHASPNDVSVSSFHKLNATTAPLDYKRSLPASDVIIDVGHGGIDGGSHHNELLEKDINLAIGKKLYLLLNSKGISSILNRNSDYALSDDNRWARTRSRHQRDLSQRGGLPDEIQTQVLVSLHVNWAKDEKHRGPLVLHQQEGESALLAFLIQDALNRQQHIFRLPKVGKPYYLLNVVKQPSVIVEIGFISNEGDRQMMTDPRKQLEIADAIASGVRNYILLR
ncbi:N-acetylmuramoyl-L-alanine amidase [Paenibacillus sp. sptzw28]|uniref:N-acetylmuramoyl-L-alanine amidase family protein n=1 Tax=Paenibacillus sp. sptzw28 TaxID=715179 RepID=UPI001C6E3ECB|nr:N-acetylmuramoyl-L-alanine amidase [Paenibacillus sp. sptzw28]QYR23549.1 N-acetylmuramoyl-L-alanine amidase [Paenibacillus sp. sptzw28]